MYSKRVWLNKKRSASTGSFVAFDGGVKNSRNQDVACTFIEVGDCDVKARLHRGYEDSAVDFIKKIKLLSKEINNFVEYLESKIR